jgi:succinate-semialdehyde dehydrogenase/glutarate-semialdehyde dehydrogenase
MLKNMSLFRSECYINGAWLKAASGVKFEVTNPATGEILGAVPNMGAAETMAAVEAAQAAMPAWAAKTGKERAEILRRWFDLIMENQADLAKLMTLEQGKPYAESFGEVGYGASFIEWFAEEAKRIYGEIVPSPMADKRIMVLKQPIGVVGAITPWNFPSAMITRKAAPALAAGCPIIIKPAQQTPYSAFALAELAHQAGIPKGIFNVITGEAKEIGGVLTSNSKVRKITFTGSTGIGKLLMRQSADTVKKLSLELGGNAPFIVFDDADVEAAVAGAMISKYRNSGQTCVCTNRFYIQSGIYDKFAKKFKAAVEQLKIGNGLDENTTQGPLIDGAAVEKITGQIADAKAKGGQVITGGALHELGGTFFQPTIITGATDDMSFTHDETFGPLAPLYRFETEEEVIRRANDTEFGLAAYFYTENMKRIWRVAEALETGMIGINTGLISTEVAPFGGVKESGLGREGSHHGMDDYLELKYLCLQI